MMLREIVVHDSRIHGRGLFATAPIACGTVVWLPCRRCARWSAAEVDQLPGPQTQWLDEFGYRLSDGGLLLPCHNAHLMNHSCEASVLDFGLDFGVAVRDIAAGEEVTCDFRTFTDDPFWQVACRCRTAGCAGYLTPQDGVDPRLQTEWRTRVHRALEHLIQAPQPLDDELIECSALYRKLRSGEGAAAGSIRAPAFLCVAEPPDSQPAAGRGVMRPFPLPLLT
jgi:hypothetical protein